MPAPETTETDAALADGVAAAETRNARLEKENGRLKAERDALLTLCVYDSGTGWKAFLGWRSVERGRMVTTESRSASERDRGSAEAAVREAAGLDAKGGD